jgi:hypothetical protein
MPSLLTLAWILVAAAIGWLVYDWSVIGSGVRAWWRRRQMRIAAKHQQKLYLANHGLPTAIRTFMKMKAR